MNGNPFPPDRLRGGMVQVGEHHGNGSHALLWVVFALLLVLLLVALVSLVLDHHHRSNAPQPAEMEAAPTGALAVLDTRYASGDLSRRDYLQARKDLLGPGAPAPT